MKRVSSLVLLLVIATMVPAMAVSSERWRHMYPGVPGWQMANTGVSLEQAASRLRKESGGRLLSAEERGENGDRVYRFKVLMPDGVVRIIRIDPMTGKQIRHRQ